MVEGDSHRFEGMAHHVADIRMDGSADSPGRTAEQQGLRPAITHPVTPVEGGRLRVEVMDPHDLWDARDGLRGRIQQAELNLPRQVEPVVSEPSLQRVSTRMAAAPSPAVTVSRTPTEAAATIQLGAYSSPQAARLAWARVSGGSASKALKGLEPVFEPAQVNGRALTRLKVAAPASAATAICRAAEVSDPWCARRT
jgi:hypothetical protein